jgi:hypothetical protein
MTLTLVVALIFLAGVGLGVLLRSIGWRSVAPSIDRVSLTPERRTMLLDATRRQAGEQGGK